MRDHRHALALVTLPSPQGSRRLTGKRRRSHERAQRSVAAGVAVGRVHVTRRTRLAHPALHPATQLDSPTLRLDLRQHTTQSRLTWASSFLRGSASCCAAGTSLSAREPPVSPVSRERGASIVPLSCHFGRP